MASKKKAKASKKAAKSTKRVVGAVTDVLIQIKVPESVAKRLTRLGKGKGQSRTAFARDVLMAVRADSSEEIQGKESVSVPAKKAVSVEEPIAAKVNKDGSTAKRRGRPPKAAVTEVTEVSAEADASVESAPAIGTVIRRRGRPKKVQPEVVPLATIPTAEESTAQAAE